MIRAVAALPQWADQPGEALPKARAIREHAARCRTGTEQESAPRRSAASTSSPSTSAIPPRPRRPGPTPASTTSRPRSGWRRAASTRWRQASSPSWASRRPGGQAHARRQARLPRHDRLQGRQRRPLRAPRRSSGVIEPMSPGRAAHPTAGRTPTTATATTAATSGSPASASTSTPTSRRPPGGVRRRLRAVPPPA